MAEDQRPSNRLITSVELKVADAYEGREQALLKHRLWEGVELPPFLGRVRGLSPSGFRGGADPGAAGGWPRTIVTPLSLRAKAIWGIKVWSSDSARH